MRGKVLVWTLNATADLLESERQGILGLFGDRAAFAGDPDTPGRGSSGGPAHNLMPDKEYFIPIAAKCLGARISDSHPEVAEIRRFYEGVVWAVGGQATSAQRYWDKPLTRGRVLECQMTTGNDEGYYDILARAAAEGWQNVLIGYSQGGLVARYLDFLDEHLFRGNAVAAVITVNSPNFGSPLANPCNAETLFDGLLEALDILSGTSDQWWSRWLLWAIQRHLDFKDLKDFTTQVETVLIEATTLGVAKEILGFLEAAIKWTSGLTGCTNPDHEATAFTDLDVRMHAHPHSVLTAVNTHLSSRYLGAVIGTDNGLGDIFDSLFHGTSGVHFNTPKTKNPAERQRKNRELETLVNERLLTDRGFCGLPSVCGGTDGPENQNGAQGLVQRLQALYHAGRPQSEGLDSLPARSHDFVIPSAYQTLPVMPPSAGLFVGERVNRLSNHNSGKDLRLPAGRQTFTLVQDLLRTMIARGL